MNRLADLGARQRQSRDRIAKQIQAAFRLGLIPPGAVSRCAVYHDDTCTIWSGKACDCQPELEFHPEPLREAERGRE